MTMLVNSFRLGLPGASTDQNFASDGANQPFLGTAVYPAALYDSSGNKTWIAWEAWNGTNRVPTVTSYAHATGYWSSRLAAGLNTLVDDDHGTPSLCLDDEGYLHCFHGSHNTDQKHSSTQWAVEGSAGAGSMWASRAAITGEYSYPHPIPIGTDIYLLIRKRITASSKYTLCIRKTATLVAGVATWNAEGSLVDFGTNTRFYMGTALKSGTDIWIIATKADLTDTKREHVYLFVYDTATGAVKNHDNSFSVASGSLPVTSADADTNYRLFTHSGGNDEGGAPGLRFDTNGDPHVIFKDGTGTSYAVKHIMRSAGTWTSPTSIATVDNRFNCPVLVQLDSAKMEAWYSVDPGSAYDRFGSIARRERASGGTWGSEQIILAAGATGLGNPSAILDGAGIARVIFSQAVNDATDAAAGNLKAYLYGSGGAIPYLAQPAATNAGTAAGHALREDGDDCLREDGTFELREA